VATTANKIKYPPDRYALSGGRRLALKDAAAALSATKHGGRDQDGVSFRGL
jgi:hypothetical protein